MQFAVQEAVSESVFPPSQGTGEQSSSGSLDLPVNQMFLPATSELALESFQRNLQTQSSEIQGIREKLVDLASEFPAVTAEVKEISDQLEIILSNAPAAAYQIDQLTK